MTRSATAARNTERTITKRVVTVVGAQRPETSLTQASTCERRMAFMGKSPKLTERTARLALALVEGTQS